ncbi:metallophosphoesterase [Candidatus Woesearchaeota archaeon]|nr:metallophosphoesterase [Candidatus Woesearchaeota archaeon]
MKILAFTDIHGSLAALRRIAQKVKTQKPDLLVCAGDISVFEQGIFAIAKRLNKLNKKIVVVHGNHEDASTFRKLSKLLKNIIFIHKSHFILNNSIFLGYGGGGFAMVDREFEKIANSRFKKLIKNNKGKKIVLVTHGPPYRTRLDMIGPEHCGNKSIRNFIEKNRVDFLVCGHLHENFGKEDRIRKTKCINPGPFGKILDTNQTS